MNQLIDKDMVAVYTFIGVDGVPFDVDVREELAFSEHTLQQATFSHSAKYVWWTEVLSHADRHYKSAVAALELLEAQLGNKARQAFDAEGKKATKDMVTDWVITQQEYQDAKTLQNDWDNRVFQLKYVVKAWEQRGNSLIQAGAQYRKEMDSQNIK